MIGKSPLVFFDSATEPMKRRLLYGILVVIPASFILTVWGWADRPAQSNRYPGYAWVATTDGTSTAVTAHVTAVLARRGISSGFDSMLVADFYVPTNEIAKARLVLAWEKLKHRNLILELH